MAEQSLLNLAQLLPSQGLNGQPLNPQQPQSLLGLDQGMGKGPGGSNDVSGYLNQYRNLYLGGQITKQQFMDAMDYYAPAR